MCHIFSGGQTINFAFLFLLYCTCVPCAVKMLHLLPAACQYVSYFVRWTNDWLCLVLLLALSWVAYIFSEHAYMRICSL